MMAEKYRIKIKASFFGKTWFIAQKKENLFEPWQNITGTKHKTADEARQDIINDRDKDESNE